MDIQNPWKSPVESCDAVFENLKEEQKNNHNSANREVFHRNPTESTVPKPTMSKRFLRFLWQRRENGIPGQVISAPLDLFHDLVDGRVEHRIGGKLRFHGIDVGVDGAVVAAEDDAHLWE